MNKRAIPVLFKTSLPALRAAFKGIGRGKANMDVLIAMGTSVSFPTGFAALITPVANNARTILLMHVVMYRHHTCHDSLKNSISISRNSNDE